MYRAGFLHHVCTKYPQKYYFSGGFQIHMGRSATVVQRPKSVHVYLQLKMRIEICIVIAHFLCPPLVPIFGNSIDAGVENSPRSPRNTIFFWSKSASPLVAKNLLAECTALMVSNFLTTHPKMIVFIMMRTVTCSTEHLCLQFLLTLQILLSFSIVHCQQFGDGCSLLRGCLRVYDGRLC